MAAPLHDIGKVGIPDAILLKPGPLTADELAIMRTHTVIGADTLAHVRKTIAGADVPFIVMAQDICLGHHEQWCGKGYPNGWSERRTPIAARIASVADYLDACLSPRPYRPQGMDFDTVVGNIAANSGTMFDPEIVNAVIADKESLRRVTI
jgi:putative two-component system response regulator